MFEMIEFDLSVGQEIALFWFLFTFTYMTLILMAVILAGQNDKKDE